MTASLPHANAAHDGEPCCRPLEWQGMNYVPGFNWMITGPAGITLIISTISCADLVFSAGGIIIIELVSFGKLTTTILPSVLSYTWDDPRYIEGL
jgi:hypothetical protein